MSKSGPDKQTAFPFVTPFCLMEYAMSARTRAIPLSSLAAIRVTCHTPCGTVVEIPPHAWSNPQALKCPSCGKLFVYSVDKPANVVRYNDQNPLPEFAALLESISKIEHAKVELIVPLEPSEFIVSPKQ
jgi:hypothetical protein